jgi:hypothetical protein
MKRQKADPARKRVVETTTKGTIYFFSLGRRPGATNFQSWWKRMGSAKKRAAKKANFMCVQKASAGAKKIREGISFAVEKVRKGYFLTKTKWFLNGSNRSPRIDSE